MNKQAIDYLINTLPGPDSSSQFTHLDALKSNPLHGVLNALVHAARDSSFGRRLVDSMVLKTPFVIAHKGTQLQLQLQCLFSLMTSPSHNVLVAKFAETVILIGQHVTSADFIYVPEHNTLIKLYHINDVGAAEVLGHFKKMVASCSLHDGCHFGGVIASHSRPSHFLYDAALSVHTVYEHFQYPEPLPIFQLHGGDFVRFSDVYGEGYFNDAGLVSYEAINQMVTEQGKLFVKLGAFHRHHDKKATAILNRFDDCLQNAARRWAEREQSPVVAMLQQYKAQGYFVVWHGIATEKRRWVDQEQAIIALVARLQARGKKVCIVLDGWTVPESQHGKTLPQIKLDMEVVEAIQAQLPEDVPCLSVVGETPLCKTVVAMMVDFHVSNGGTGSLYVSRVAKKPGVLHIGNATREMIQNTLHYNSFFVPESLVVDVPSKTQVRIDYVSYSILPQDFADFALLVLDNKVSDSRLLPSEHETEAGSLKIRKVHGCDIHPTGYRFYSHGNDPYFFFELSDDFFAQTEPLVLQFKVATDLDLSTLRAKIYLDTGTGFSEKNTMFAQYNGLGEAVFTLEQPEKLKNFRFDPFACKGAFSLEQAKVMPVQKS